MPVRPCVTVSLVPEARGGPFVYWDDLPAACRSARALGFEAIEIFPRSPDAVDPAALRTLLDSEGLQLAAMGTGAGWVVHQWRLTDPRPEIREHARAFIRSVIDRAGPFGAPAIIGSMQGRTSPGVDKPSALGLLADALEDLGEHAKGHGVPLLYEPLNRYETDLVNTVEAGLALLDRLSSKNVRLLADLFHMNIEEVDIASALRLGASAIGHLHFVDSNRRAAGFGHLDFGPIARALAEVGYDGHASAEALPLPDPKGAAEQTIKAFGRVFLGN